MGVGTEEVEVLFVRRLLRGLEEHAEELAALAASSQRRQDEKIRLAEERERNNHVDTFASWVVALTGQRRTLFSCATGFMTRKSMRRGQIGRCTAAKSNS